MSGFPLQGSEWYFTIFNRGRTWFIEISNNGKVVVEVSASNERLCKERAWNALEKYCFRAGR